MPSSGTAYFLDFDHTLFHTDRFFHVDARTAFLRLGISPADWEQGYAAAWPTGFTLEKLAEGIFRRSGARLSPEEMKQVLRNSFSDLRAYLFPDVFPFLHRTKKNGARLFLLSFGDEEWQRYKVLASHLDEHFDGMFFTAVEGGKAGLVQEQRRRLVERNLAVVDNDPEELDLIRDIVPEARTYLMNRVPDDARFPSDERSRLQFLEARRYLNKTARHPHIACRSLDDVSCGSAEPDG